MITANKIAITSKDIALVICQNEVAEKLLAAAEVGVEVDVKIGEGEEVGKGLD